MTDDDDDFDLFSEPRARHGDPDTSHDAAEHIDVTRLRGLIIGVLKQRRNGLAAIEIAREVGIHPWSITPRMKPMEEDRLVIRLPKRVVINSEGNPRMMVIWTLHPRVWEKLDAL